MLSQVGKSQPGMINGRVHGGALGVHEHGRAPLERRDTSPEGAARRARFEESLELLRALGLSPFAIEHYRRLARKTRKLPHELVRTLVEETAEQPDILTLIGVNAGRPA
ncbi:MAG TPA: hypothetical protein VKZ50_04855 [bacterium]|nr:hypothetical protein [bacterium]